MGLGESGMDLGWIRGRLGVDLVVSGPISIISRKISFKIALKVTVLLWIHGNMGKW